MQTFVDDVYRTWWSKNLVVSNDTLLQVFRSYEIWIWEQQFEIILSVWIWQLRIRGTPNIKLAQRTPWIFFQKTLSACVLCVADENKTHSGICSNLFIMHGVNLLRLYLKNCLWLPSRKTLSRFAQRHLFLLNCLWLPSRKTLSRIAQRHFFTHYV